jgi:ribonucleotide reductase alpha subunit
MNNTIEMRVTKRNGELQEIAFDKILERVKKLGQEANIQINYSSLVMKVIDQLYDKILTCKIDELAAEQCASLSTNHPDYAILAGRIIVSNHQKNTEPLFTEVVEKMYIFKNSKGENKPLVSESLYEFTKNYKNEINSMIDHNRDYLIDYFGFKTLERAYLFKINDVIVERPQHMWMRVAIGIHGNAKKPGQSLTLIKETYNLMSQKFFTHATPTLFNAGTPNPQLSSCYLIAMEEDSISGIYNTLKDCAQISKYSGGIGLHIHNIRGKGSHIQGTNGKTDGIVPMLRVFNSTARYVNQSGKRNGSFAIYLEPWHPDIEDFLELRKNHGEEELKARDLFYAMWISDLFMERVKENKQWALFCPNECPGLDNVYGDNFKHLYEKYENNGLAKKVINARDLWFKILDAQMETGTPYILYKDACNLKSNQQNLGTIKSSNLCVSPKTKVLTDKGDIEIYTLENKNVNVWNGKEFSNVIVKKTGVLQPLITVYFDNNYTIECTPEHKFYVLGEIDNQNIVNIILNKNNKDKKRYVIKIDAKDLKIGMELEPFELPNNCNNTKKLNYVKVKGIIDNGFKADTYCFTEPLRNRGTFNGIVTGQCTEILEYSDENETAVCNLASIALSSFVNIETKYFDYDKLHEVTKVVTNNLNEVIDINFYPTDKTKTSNLKHRPIGIGVQGLADTFILLDLPFYSDEAKEINKLIFETMYHAALEKSNEISIERSITIKNSSKSELIKCLNEYDYNMVSEENIHLDYDLVGSYSSFKGSPASKGILQFDMWGVEPSKRYNWDSLKDSIIKFGLRNSLLLAPMPTASTSQILGFNECFEPITSNLYSRRTLAGEFVVVNKYLMRELIDLGLWNEQIKNNIIANKGSVQQLQILSEHMRNKYKIVWEIPMKILIDMSADRGAFICQSQSLNLWMEDPTYNSLTSMHFYSWKKGLKTGIYYLRRKAKHQAQQFTIEPELKEEETLEKDEICEMCSA